MLKKILLIDGNAILYRSFYATYYKNKDAFLNMDKQPVNAVLIFHKMLMKYLKEYNPNYILIAFDKGSKTFRHKYFQDYKQNRPKTPLALISQISLTKEMLKLMNICYVEKELIEADDLIASASNKWKNSHEILIVSSDKDLQQLISSNIKIVVPNSKGDQIIDEHAFMEINGFEPIKLIDYKAIAGDSSDNIPGIPGIGPKTTLNLIKEFDSLDNIIKMSETIKNQTIKSKINNFKDKIMVYKKIITLIKDEKIDLDLENIEVNYEISKNLIAFFKKYHLNSLVKKYENQKKLLKNSNEDFDNILF